MNTYNYSLSDETLVKLSPVLNLYRPLYRGIIVSSVMVTVVFFIMGSIHLYSEALWLLPFMLLGAMLGVFSGWLGIRKTIKKIASINTVEWDDKNINFLRDGDVIYSSTPDSLLIKYRDDLSIIFHIKSTNKYMRPPTPLAISLPETNNNNLNELLDQWET